MNTMSADLVDELTEARRRVEAHCQSLVDSGVAQWWINDDGDVELHMDSGEVYLFGDHGVTRLNLAAKEPEPATAMLPRF